MELGDETFRVWADLEGREHFHFLVTRSRGHDEWLYEILSDDKACMGILHKTFEDTWECLQGKLTLQDAERLGDQIEAYYSK